MFDGVRYILKIYEKYDDVPTSLTLVSLGIKLRLDLPLYFQTPVIT